MIYSGYYSICQRGGGNSSLQHLWWLCSPLWSDTEPTCLIFTYSPAFNLTLRCSIFSCQACCPLNNIYKAVWSLTHYLDSLLILSWHVSSNYLYSLSHDMPSHMGSVQLPLRGSVKLLTKTLAHLHVVIPWSCTTGIPHASPPCPAQPPPAPTNC